MKEGWEYKKLDEVCYVEYGTRVVQKKDGGTIYPVYGGGGETFRMDRFNRSDSIVIARFAMSKQCTRFVKGKFFLNDSGLTIRSKVDKIAQDFLNWHIIALNDEIYLLGKGMAQKNLDMPSFRNITLKIPPLSEQQHIVEELDLLSSIIEKKKAQLKELDNLAQSLFYEMFGSPTINEKGFPLLTVNDVIKFEGGSQPPKTSFEYTPTPNNIRLIQIRDYKTDAYITYVPKKLARKFCDEDDIMIGRYGPPIFQILKGLSGAYNVALMKAVPLKGNKEFVRAYLKQKCLLHYLETFSRRVAGQDGIQMDKLKAYPFPYPPIDLQNQFASKIEAIEHQKELIKQSIKEVETLFNSRMDYYFN